MASTLRQRLTSSLAGRLQKGQSLKVQPRSNTLRKAQSSSQTAYSNSAQQIIDQYSNNPEWKVVTENGRIVSVRKVGQYGGVPENPLKDYVAEEYKINSQGNLTDYTKNIILGGDKRRQVVRVAERRSYDQSGGYVTSTYDRAGSVTRRFSAYTPGTGGQAQALGFTTFATNYEKPSAKQVAEQEKARKLAAEFETPQEIKPGVYRFREGLSVRVIKSDTRPEIKTTRQNLSTLSGKPSYNQAILKSFREENPDTYQQALLLDIFRRQGKPVTYKEGVVTVTEGGTDIALGRGGQIIGTVPSKSNAIFRESFISGDDYSRRATEATRQKLERDAYLYQATKVPLTPTERRDQVLLKREERLDKFMGSLNKFLFLEAGPKADTILPDVYSRIYQNRRNLASIVLQDLLLPLPVPTRTIAAIGDLVVDDPELFSTAGKETLKAGGRIILDLPIAAPIRTLGRVSAFAADYYQGHELEEANRLISEKHAGKRAPQDKFPSPFKSGLDLIDPVIGKVRQPITDIQPLLPKFSIPEPIKRAVDDINRDAEIFGKFSENILIGIPRRLIGEPLRSIFPDMPELTPKQKMLQESTELVGPALVESVNPKKVEGLANILLIGTGIGLELGGARVGLGAGARGGLRTGARGAEARLPFFFDETLEGHTIPSPTGQSGLLRYSRIGNVKKIPYTEFGLIDAETGVSRGRVRIGDTEYNVISVPEGKTRVQLLKKGVPVKETVFETPISDPLPYQLKGKEIIDQEIILQRRAGFETLPSAREEVLFKLREKNSKLSDENLLGDGNLLGYETRVLAREEVLFELLGKESKLGIRDRMLSQKFMNLEVRNVVTTASRITDELRTSQEFGIKYKLRGLDERSTAQLSPKSIGFENIPPELTFADDVVLLDDYLSVSLTPDSLIFENITVPRLTQFGEEINIIRGRGQTFREYLKPTKKLKKADDIIDDVLDDIPIEFGEDIPLDQLKELTKNYFRPKVSKNENSLVLSEVPKPTIRKDIPKSEVSIAIPKKQSVDQSTEVVTMNLGRGNSESALINPKLDEGRLTPKVNIITRQKSELNVNLPDTFNLLEESRSNLISNVGIVSITGISTKASIVSITSPKSKTSQKNRSDLISNTSTASITGISTKASIISITSPKSKTSQKSAMDLIYLSSSLSGRSTNLRRQIPEIQPPQKLKQKLKKLIPLLFLNTSKKTKIKNRRKRINYSYTPDLTALIYNQRGKKARTYQNTGVYTGLERRRIIKETKKKKTKDEGLLYL